MSSVTADIDPAEFYGISALPPSDVTQPTEPTEERTTGKPTADRRGRFAVLNGFVDHSMCELTFAQQSVWFVLFRDTRDGVARTSQSDIARRVGVCRKTVNRALAELEQLGLVRVIYRGGMPRRVSAYRVRGSIKRAKQQRTPESPNELRAGDSGVPRQGTPA